MRCTLEARLRFPPQRQTTFDFPVRDTRFQNLNTQYRGRMIGLVRVDWEFLKDALEIISIILKINFKIELF